jgi:hypothetical protein
LLSVGSDARLEATMFAGANARHAAHAEHEEMNFRLEN